MQIKTNVSGKRLQLLLLCLSSCFVTVEAIADEAMFEVQKPAISIIIDDVGYQLKSGLRAVNLQGDLTLSFLPHTPYAASLSKLAHANNKEIMLHLPMESEAGLNLGPGGLTAVMSEKEFSHVIESSIRAIPHARGFNNHMGSLLTKSQFWMQRLMHKVARENDLFFVDSKTTSQSVAFHAARAEGLKSIPRDIFIDHKPSSKFINGQLQKLILIAEQNGTALAIAHPKKLTLSILEKWLPELKARGIQLVSVSKLISLRQQQKLALLNLPDVNPQRSKN